MEKQKVYLAGGFRSNWQEKVINELGDRFIFFNPREHELENYKEYWTWDIHFIKQCDILFAYMEETNPSGFGLTLEIGIAHSLNKTIILVDEKSMNDNDFGKYFKIVYPATNAIFHSIEEGIFFLKKF